MAGQAQTILHKPRFEELKKVLHLSCPGVEPWPLDLQSSVLADWPLVPVAFFFLSANGCIPLNSVGCKLVPLKKDCYCHVAVVVVFPS